ncbi:hypothetical protein F4819DRAFT_487428 [Hypoxylon fuscum]|nr:hypothetical protein F4819DRAFT_487428 [Hypoxylon fuscum]
MCKVYKIKYTCGCTEDQVAACAESPNNPGGCSRGTVPEYVNRIRATALYGH